MIFFGRGLNGIHKDFIFWLRNGHVLYATVILLSGGSSLNGESQEFEMSQ